MFNHIFIFLFFNKFVSNYVVLPFISEQKIINTSLEFEKQLENYFEKDKILTTLSFGEYSKGLLLYLSLNEYAFFLSNAVCYKNNNSFYNPLLSKSFINITEYIGSFPSNIKYCKATEKCSLYNDIYLNTNISINNLSFIFEVNEYYGKIENTTQICGYIGLQIHNNNNEYQYQYKNDYFVNSLKKSDIINSYAWTILYLNNTIEKNDILNYTNEDYEGLLICGINENEYKSIFKTDNIKTIKAEVRGSDIYWDMINIKSSYQHSNNKYEFSDIRVTFNNEINYIICSHPFFNSIKDTFFNIPLKNNICSIIEKLEPMGSSVIVCEKKILEKIKDFPIISLIHEELDFIFEITYKDLFIEYNNKIIFLLIYNAYGFNYWSLGKIFMRKYPFIFDYDKKTINFVNIYNINKSDFDKKNQKNENKKSFWKYLKIILIIFLIIIGNIIGIIIGAFFWNKKRKKRANELDDDFEYKMGKNEKLQNEEKEQNKVNSLYNENSD